MSKFILAVIDMEYVKKSTSAYILAGGKSKRFGQDKSMYVYEDKPLIKHVFDAVSPAFDDVVIISNEKEKYSFLTTNVIPDLIPDLGPAGGLYTALSHASTDRVFLFACDMPFLSTEFIEYMLEMDLEYDIIAPHVSGQYEPLHAIYYKSCLPAIKAFIDRGDRRMNDFCIEMDIRPVGENEVEFYEDPMKIFNNVNNPDDIQLMH